jgi:hypothetical protein
MTVEAIIDDALPTPPDTRDAAEIVGFLSRFSKLISTGENAGNLRRAAALIDLLNKRALEAEHLLAEQRDASSKYFEMCEAFELLVDRLTSEAAMLGTQLKQKDHEAFIEQTRLRDEAERLAAAAARAEAELAIATAELEALRSRPAGPGDGRVVVPVATLHALRDQFEVLSDELATGGGVIAQVMSEIGGCAIRQAISDAMPKAAAPAQIAAAASSSSL